MKFLVIFISLIALASCGKQVKKNTSNNTKEIISGYLDLSTGLVGSSDLLTVTLDVPAVIDDHQIVIKSTKMGRDTGETITCSIEFTQGEIYSYILRGPQLLLTNSNGRTYTMKRVGSGDSIVGSWSWSGVENGAHIHRRFSIPNSSRFIVNMDCES